jgi:hypothetical protein
MDKSPQLPKGFLYLTILSPPCFIRSVAFLHKKLRHKLYFAIFLLVLGYLPTRAVFDDLMIRLYPKITTGIVTGYDMENVDDGTNLLTIYYKFNVDGQEFGGGSTSGLGNEIPENGTEIPISYNLNDPSVNDIGVKDNSSFRIYLDFALLLAGIIATPYAIWKYCIKKDD